MEQADRYSAQLRPQRRPLDEGGAAIGMRGSFWVSGRPERCGRGGRGPEPKRSLGTSGSTAGRQRARRHPPLGCLLRSQLSLPRQHVDSLLSNACGRQVEEPLVFFCRCGWFTAARCLQALELEAEGRRLNVDELDQIVEDGLAIPVASAYLEVRPSLIDRVD